ncbi:MAG: glycosyltransferase family 2 protein [Patescibacteria group bacterium]
MQEVPKSKKLISILIPCFNEAGNIAHSYHSILDYLNDSGLLKSYNFEIVYIDDGSLDQTIKEIKKLSSSKYLKIIPLELSKNFGKEIAITAGLNCCSGSAAIMFDADMQYPIEKLAEFIDSWEVGGDIVIGVRDSKKTNNIVDRLGSSAFYFIMQKIASVEVVSGALDYRLLDRHVIDEFVKFTERGRITRFLIDWLGFKKVYIKYQEKPRKYGMPSYSFSKRVKLAINSVINHSFLPMDLIGVIGSFSFFISAVVGFVLLVFQVLNDPFDLAVTSGAKLSIFNTFLTSLVLISLWLLSKYIANIQREVINRPLYIIKKQR